MKKEDKKNENPNARFGRKDISILSAKFKKSGKTLSAFSEEEKLNIVDHHALKREIEGPPKKKKTKRY